jgi:hypothetical protein
MESHDWIPVDGDFGPATEAKTRDFQSCANYYLGAGLVVDGKVGPKTAWWLEYVVKDAAPFC